MWRNYLHHDKFWKGWAGIQYVCKINTGNCSLRISFCSSSKIVTWLWLPNFLSFKTLWSEGRKSDPILMCHVSVGSSVCQEVDPCPVEGQDGIIDKWLKLHVRVTQTDGIDIAGEDVLLLVDSFSLGKVPAQFPRRYCSLHQQARLLHPMTERGKHWMAAVSLHFLLEWEALENCQALILRLIFLLQKLLEFAAFSYPKPCCLQLHT